MAKYSLLEQHNDALASANTIAQLHALRQQRPAVGQPSWQQERQVLQRQLAAVEQEHLDAQQQQQQLQQQMNALLTALPVGVIGLDHQGRIALVNQPAADILSLNAAQLKGRSWSALIHSLLSPRQDDGHEVTLINGKRISLATQGMAGQGQFLVLSDLSSTRALQEELHQQQRLADMGKMVASLAHQIRTPLATATLYVGNLLRFQPPAAQQQQFLHKINGSLKHLEQQVRDMLSFVRGQAQRNDALSFAQFVSHLQQHLQPLADLKQAQMHWQVSGSGRLLINQELLLGAIANLVSNAIEASDERPVELWIHLTCDQRLTLTVRDQGQGMTAEQILATEQAFYTTKSTGTGLGLSVVRSVVKAHHGQLTIESQPQQGTTVSLCLAVLQTEESSDDLSAITDC